MLKTDEKLITDTRRYVGSFNCDNVLFICTEGLSSPIFPISCIGDFDIAHYFKGNSKKCRLSTSVDEYNAR